LVKPFVTLKLLKRMPPPNLKHLKTRDINEARSVRGRGRGRGHKVEAKAEAEAEAEAECYEAEAECYEAEAEAEARVD